MFDAYAPEGFGEFDNPVVFEIKYSKYTDGAISSLNSFVKKIMSAGIPSATTVVFITNVELVDDESMQTKWRYFLRTLHNPDIPFAQVTDRIEKFLKPVWCAINNCESFNLCWKSTLRIWK